ncbi:MAG TPA: PKD domain-containing protein [Terriglobales bacterium]|nr:PKD domain-containing protein [Terriglobales bacterium]
MIEMRRRTASLLLLAFAFAAGGCGGCQDERAPQTAPAPQQVAASPTAAAAATKPVVPTKALPPPLPTTIQGTEAEEEQDAAAAADDDCFVMMDAFPDYGPPPLKVKFTSEVECNSGQPTFKWDFGDGSQPSTEANPSHTYAKEGEFVASVTVTGPSGGTDTDEMDVVVEKDAEEPKPE